MKINKKLLILPAIILGLAGVLFFYKNINGSIDSNGNSSGQSLAKLNMALDWSPNTNHTGIYVAIKKGWYREQGIDLQLLPYSTNVSSDSLVIAGKAEVGIGFTEGIVADAGVGTPVVSIASIVAHNTSVVLARKDAGINSPKDLAGKTFGGYGAPYEQPVMSQLIKNDGGSGEFKNITVDTDPIDALASKRVDFVWVFDGWEGIQVQLQNLDVKKFYLTDYGIPDYSTPNIISSPETIEKKADLLKKFMKATAKGYEFARTNPDESAQILIDTVEKGTFPDTKLVFDSQKYLSQKYQDSGKSWGIAVPEIWQKYPQFMLENNAVLDEKGKPVTRLDFTALYTNKFLQ